MILRILAAALALAVLSATGARAASSEGGKLHAALQSADEDDLALNPMSGLLRGDLRRAGEFGDLITDDYYARAAANLEKQLAALRRIDRSRLDPKEKIAYDSFKYAADFALEQHREGILRIARQWPIDPVFGQHLVFQQLSSGGGAAAFATVADYENGLKRLDGFVAYLDRSIGRMREGVRDGRALPRMLTAKVLQQLDTELANTPEKSPFYQPAANFPASFSAGERKRLASAYKSRISQRVHPAFKRLRAYMGGAYLAAGRIDKPGLAGVPDGVRFYRYQLESHTTTKLTADEIHRMGLAEVERILREMDAVRTQAGFAGDRAAFFGYLQTDARFKFASTDALLAGYRDVQRRVEAILPRYFAATPRGRLEIRPVPPEQEGSAGGAYYLVGTPDGQRSGVFFVNTSNLPTRTTPRMTALFLHEGMPGHHLQGSLASEDEALPPNLRFSWNPGFGEGWALYAEWLGTEMGLYDDPYQYFGRLDMEILRAARLVVDTGLHAYGWSRDQAIEYMLANTTLDRRSVEQEVDRYIVWPGQATAYKVGELYIRELRSRAESRLGPAFDIRRFHQTVLDTGALPLHVLGQKVDAWIDDALNPRRTP